MGARRVFVLGLMAAAVAACTSVAPQASTIISNPATPVPGTSLPPSAAVPTLPQGTSTSASLPATAVPDTSAPQTPAPTTETTPAPTPKPTKKPTPTPSPTPTPIAGDVEASILETSVPNPFYNNTDYTITVYVSALGTTNLPNVHVKLVAKNEAVSFKFDTGPINYGDTYSHDVTLNLPAIGPSALILTATMPDGYVDTNKANNTDTVDIDVLLAP